MCKIVGGKLTKNAVQRNWICLCLRRGSEYRVVRFWQIECFALHAFTKDLGYCEQNKSKASDITNRNIGVEDIAGKQNIGQGILWAKTPQQDKTCSWLLRMDHMELVLFQKLTK